MRNLVRIALILSLNVPSAFASESKDEYREKIRNWVRAHASLTVPTVAPAVNDQAANLVDELRLTTLAQIEAAGLLQARLEVTPWSGSYWPTYAGGIANRYGDARYIPDLSWKQNARYLEGVLGRGTSKELSAAEKYDLLVGDANFTLTKNGIQAGAPYAERDGTVPTWFGICHGWAPAAFMESRPERLVKTKAADGREIEFTPADLKALASLLWANGAGETRFIGGRCNATSPGRTPDCVDTNPATWHLAVVNQIGVSKRSFVADVSAGSEVWNQPAVGYRYSYVNAATGAPAATLAAAKVKLADWRQDPYASTRARKAVSVVKIQMQFEYGAETQPETTGDDSAAMDAHASLHLSYDLELDENDEIVGGEWYTAAHPDFLWVPVKGSKASSTGDSLLDRRNDHSSWERGQVVPKAWRDAAKQSSADEAPLARIVGRLLDFARAAN